MIRAILTGNWIVVKTNAQQRRVFAYWLTIVSFLLIPFSFLMGWAQNVSFVTLLSLLALAIGGFSTLAAETPVEEEHDLRP